jgi:hypothetical protein
VDRRDLLLPLQLPAREYAPPQPEDGEQKGGEEEEDEAEAEMDDEGTEAAGNSSDDEPLVKYQAAAADSESDDDSDSDTLPLAAFRPEVLPKGTASRPSPAPVQPKAGKIIIKKKRKLTSEPEVRDAADEKPSAAKRKKVDGLSPAASSAAAAALPKIRKKVRGGTWTAGPKGCYGVWEAKGGYHGMTDGWYYLPSGVTAVPPPPPPRICSGGPSHLLLRLPENGTP